MKHKIAVINFISPGGALLAKALSCLSGYELVQNRTVYEWRRMFGVKESKIHSFNNQLLILSLSFIERITIEFDYSDFISAGAVFTDVLSLQSRIDEKRVECNSPEDAGMIESLLDLSGRYAARHYDTVIHVRNADSTAYDEQSVGFYEKYHIAYHLFDSTDPMKDIIESIIRKVEIPTLRSVDNAIYEATRIVTLKN